MDNQQSKPTTTPDHLIDDGDRSERDLKGVEVYDRPAQRGIPLWLVLLVLAILMILAWFIYRGL